LPLVNLSPDATNDYFADGLTGEIIRNLFIIEGLAVRSQTSSFVFKSKPQNVRDASRQLNVEYILEGSVFRSGQQLLIDVQLVRVRDDFALWSAKYDRELTDVFAIQDEISRGIVNRLRLKLGRGRRRYETSVEAYDFYLRARSFGIFNLRPAMQAVHEAIVKDPSFAPAYAGIASARAYRSGFDKFDPAAARGGDVADAGGRREGDSVGPFISRSTWRDGHGLRVRWTVGRVEKELPASAKRAAAIGSRLEHPLRGKLINRAPDSTAGRGGYVGY